MPLNIDREMSELARLSIDGLRARYAELFGEPPRTRHRHWLVRRILWRRQALDEGDLSERARRRAAELANDADLRMLPPRRATTCSREIPARRIDSRLPPLGTTITRRFKERDLEVRVLERGFEYEGVTFKSLSAVARAITGQHCNGFHFFRLSGEEVAQ
jgi:hypothetical protein